ncbi:hypothetical protein QR680_001388 [Steinernema hermaphroditum]|uniref:Uncharacterized protein n=1 Tax=Steinernema hermaphroditum TaxID=289476 RepID=A0AA39GY67_9BILA|nr:hypothetical protein QR680_001388 [Steinernema hermaphroditum]
MFRYTDFETTVYSSLFGEMDVDSTQLGGTPYQDVVIRCFVHVDYRGPNDCRFRAIRVKSIEYDDAPLVNDAPWNRSCKSKLPIYDDDSDDNYDPLGLSKPKTQREGSLNPVITICVEMTPHADHSSYVHAFFTKCSHLIVLTSLNWSSSAVMNLCGVSLTSVLVILFLQGAFCIFEEHFATFTGGPTTNLLDSRK